SPTDALNFFANPVDLGATGAVSSKAFQIQFDMTTKNAGSGFNGSFDVGLSVPNDPNQWTGAGGGSFNNPGNWSKATVPTGGSASGNFLGNLKSDSTITFDSPTTLGSINFLNPNQITLAGPSAITLNSSTGLSQINLNGGSHTISAPLVLQTSLTQISCGGGSLTLDGIQRWQPGATVTLLDGTLDYEISLPG